MKALQIFFIILLFASPLYADQALVLTEIEQIQEKLWRVQRTVAAQKTSLEEQQKQLGLIASKAEAGRLEITERLTALTQTTDGRQLAMERLENDLQGLHEALTKLTKEVRQKDSAILEQAEKIGVLEGSLQALREESVSKQSGLAQEAATRLSVLEQEIAENRKQLAETRSKFDELGQNVGGRIEQIGLWGGGAALFLGIMLTIVVAGRKSKPKAAAPARKPSQRHEM